MRISTKWEGGTNRKKNQKKALIHSSRVCLVEKWELFYLLFTVYPFN